MTNSKNDAIIRKRDVIYLSKTNINGNSLALSHSPNIDSVLENLMSIKNDHFDPEKLFRECTNIPHRYRGKYYISNKKGDE